MNRSLVRTVLVTAALLICAAVSFADDILVRPGKPCTVFVHVIAANGSDGLTGQTGKVMLVRLDSATGTIASGLSTNSLRECVGKKSPGLYALTLTSQELAGADLVNGYYQSRASAPSEFTLHVLRHRK